jgi:hypothetical protein
MAAIEAVAEEVAENLEEVAAVTRGINGKSVGLVFSGVLVGAAVGFYFGYRYNREKIRAEAFADSEDEIAKIRETYAQKTVAATPKPTVAEVIEERGYSVQVTEDELAGRPLKPPVPVRTPPPTSVIGPPGHIPAPIDSIEVVIDGEWDYPAELAARTPDEPYVIHHDEFGGTEEYGQVTYTYYAGDDVLVGEDERPLPHADAVVGQNNLKWGHGSGNIDVVFVRNDKLQLEMEICRVPTSYEEEVLGLGHDESN